jgi:mRNA interferase MazF
VLILAQVPGPYDDFVVMFISTQIGLAMPGVDLVLRPLDVGFSATGLKAASVFRLGKIASLSSALVLGPLGHMPEPYFGDLTARLVQLLQSGRVGACRQ